jgi:Reverse transcriptase (RNA-dependent DNA polymerase).
MRVPESWSNRDSYPAHISFRVKVNGAIADCKLILAGVHQGSRLSPMLYNVYKLDIPKSIGRELAIYGDDICVYEQNKSPLFTLGCAATSKRGRNVGHNVAK